MKRTAKRLAAVSAIAVASILGYGALQPAPSSNTTTAEDHSPETLFSATPAFAQEDGAKVADIAEQAVKSVVSISTEQVRRVSMRGMQGHPLFERFFGPGMQPMPQEHRARGMGSGVIVSVDGIVLTNNHVVENGENIRVTLSDGREFDAQVLGTDPESDLAVLKLQGKVGKLTPIKVGDSETLRLGEVVLAIGNPFGVGQTVTMGIVSAKGRADVGIVDYENFIQTDAAINPGNSGGALVNMRGELVGINTAILSRSGGYQGIGFAIPTSMAVHVKDSIVKSGKVTRGWLGVGIQDIKPDLAEALGLQDTRGVLISQVMEDGPADKAGLKQGDVVREIDGKPMNTLGQLRNAIASAGANKSILLNVVRDRKPLRITATLGQKKEIAEQAQQPGGMVPNQLGLAMTDLNASLRKELGVPNGVDGAVVRQVAPGSRAARAGLESGDVIVAVAGRRVGSAKMIEQRLKTSKGSVPILVQRNGRALYLAFPGQ